MPETSAPPVIEARDVSRRYGSRWALAHVSFQLASGESLLLTGHNGAGKTTLLRLLASAVRPTLGTLLVAGFDVGTRREEVRLRTALLSHASFLYEDLTAEENLGLVVDAIGATRAEARTMLDRVGLAERARHPVREFSAGMRKRLSAARLLLQRPLVALLDEPFGELDPEGMRAMEGFIRELQASGTSVVLATHLVAQGQRLCGRRLHLSKGRAVDEPSESLDP